MTYLVTDLSPVSHSGKILSEGQEVSGLSEQEAKQLLSLGVIKAKAKATPAGKGEP